LIQGEKELISTYAKVKVFSMLKDTLFPTKITLRLHDRCLSLAEPVVMGILNLTPDSFFEDSRIVVSDTFFADNLLSKAEKMLDEGATMLDLGAYSTRPGAVEVSAGAEVDRLLSALELLRKNFPTAVLSIDTFRASVARQAITAGGHLVNDVSGGTLDPEMFQTVANLQVPYILMHMRGTPANMQQLTSYQQLETEVAAHLFNRAAELHALGLQDVILDPGFGFAKTLEQNFRLLHQLTTFCDLGYPLLVGLSRKSMIYRTLGTDAAGALNGTTALNTIALTKGARILRVHDVQPAMEAIQLWRQFENN
jgi:dihydropteroate synthase